MATGLTTLRQYQAKWLPNDIVAGLVLATMLVPVGIAYAVASACRASTVSTQLLCRCWRMRFSDQVAFWSWGRTHP
jgi:hypothetical protein